MKNRTFSTDSKATNIIVTPEFLQSRIVPIGPYPKQKWIEFCETLMAEGYTLSLYEARATVSKYITVRSQGKAFKVRFSNHKPIKGKEMAGDCDFFVGRTHTGVRTTGDALIAVREFFSGQFL
jgi:hypothetical protein